MLVVDRPGFDAGVLSVQPQRPDRTPHEGTAAVSAISLARQPVAPSSPHRQEGAVIQATPMPKWAGPNVPGPTRL